MSTLIILLRTVSLLAFAGPMLLLDGGGRHAESKTRASQRDGGRGRTPVLANFLSFGLFFPSLFIFAGSTEAPMALPLALSGSLLALAGVALVLKSRAELGPAWNLVPKADQGLVTTGPYRLVRHPIYLGLAMLAAGQALAFGSWPALLIVVCGVVPTFAWRAHAEERLLSRALGERYAVYRQRTKMILPHVL